MQKSTQMTKQKSASVFKLLDEYNGTNKTFPTNPVAVTLRSFSEASYALIPGQSAGDRFSFQIPTPVPSPIPIHLRRDNSDKILLPSSLFVFLLCVEFFFVEICPIICFTTVVVGVFSGALQPGAFSFFPISASGFF